MTVPRGHVRFVLEGVFLMAVAGILVVLAPGWIAVVGVLAGALLLAVGFERQAAARERRGEPLLARRRERAAEPAPEREPSAHVVGAEHTSNGGAPAAAVQSPANGHEPREWNVWVLDRLARDGAGVDAARDEERALLLMHLRQFAGPDGLLPASFDDLVRESFGELTAVGSE